MLTRRIAGPIVELSDATRDVAAGNLSRRVNARGADEIAALARSFNAMAAGLEHQQALRRNLVSDVAHELRTPLTALRCRLESIIDGVAADPQQALDGANEEVRHLSRLVDDLQELALAEAGELALAMTAVDIADVIASAARATGLDADPTAPGRSGRRERSARRSGARPPGAREPDDERRPPYAGRRDDRSDARRGTAAKCTSRCATPGSDLTDEQTGARVRSVLSRRSGPPAHDRRHRARARHRQASRRGAAAGASGPTRGDGIAFGFALAG